jgi:hypothetical protein
MSRFEVTRDIAAPAEAVFDRAADFEDSARTVEAIKRVEMLTEGDVGVGTRFRETREMFGREATEELEVVEFERPRRYVLGAENHGARYLSEMVFEPLPEGGTRVRMTFEARPVTFLARIMAFLTKPMMKKMVDVCAKDLDDLARVCERR